MFDTVHARTLKEETCCGLPIMPILRVTGVFTEDFWGEDEDEPMPDACRRCVAAVRLFLREFSRDCEMRHPSNPDHWLNCWCGRYGNGGS